MATDPDRRFQTAEALAAALRERSDVETTAPITGKTRVRAVALSAPDVAQEPTARIRPEPTAVLEVPASEEPAAPASTYLGQSSRAGAPPAPRRSRVGDPDARWRFLAIVAAAALALGLVLALSFMVGDVRSPSSPTRPAAAGSPISPELDRALDRLQEAVRP
jgi:hypothetical protein